MTMPPKAAPRPKPPLSKSRELVPVGPREVFKKSHGRQRDENGHKPLTARALVLRNGKHGAMGTGEVVLASRMSGREKLDLLGGMWPSFIYAARSYASSEDLMARYAQAIAPRFTSEAAIKIAEAKFLGMLPVSPSYSF